MNVLGGPTDSSGRRIEYLRISLTERCDLRCAYCRPAGRTDTPAVDLLSADDVAAVAHAALALGIRRIRLTGGEPLLRPDIEHIVGRLGELPGLADLALTTNGRALSQRAIALAAAGLRRVNVSLDSVDPHMYAAITGGGDVGAVLGGLDAALAAGLAPVKINVVLAGPASLDRSGIAGFVALARNRPLHIRFIEVMPTCSHTAYVPAQRVLDLLAEFGTLTPVIGPEGGGPARYFQLDGSQGTLGVITPLSAPFCARCNRLRVSARGELLPCLFSPRGSSLLPALRGDDPIRHLVALLREGAAAKPSRYRDVWSPTGVAAMHVVGG